ncbi:MAG: hypothetical protein KIS92_19370 [Planctomycetota bacterium]|nr:hypothetical protein [Planctomycetota bacterium]
MAALTGLALFLALASASQAFALSWTCPVCGQSFPFDRRDGAHMNSFASRHLAMHGGSGSGGGVSSGGAQTPEPQAPPDPLPGLRSAYQHAYRALQEAFGPYAVDLPGYAHASTVPALGLEVARCQAHVDAVVERFDGAGRSLQGELSGIEAALGDQRRAQEGMQEMLARLRERVRLLEQEAGGLEDRRREKAERLAALKAKAREIEEASAPVRERIFATLEETRKAGIVRPPSGFAEWIRLPEVETRTTTWSRDPNARAQAAAVPAQPVQARLLTPAADVAARPALQAPAQPREIE